MTWFRREFFRDRLQAECLRNKQKAINAKNVKNVLANMFGGNQAVAFA